MQNANCKLRLNCSGERNRAFCILQFISWVAPSLLFMLLANSGALQAHPVPRRSHDRTIVVRLSPDSVVVDYRLEVDEFTVVFDDLPALADQVDLSKLRKPQE